MGSLYRQTLRSGEKSPVWTMKYTANGRTVRLTTGTTDRRKAARILRDRQVRADRGEAMLPRTDRVTYDEAAADLRAHYETTGRRNLVEADKRFKPLARFFTGYKLAAIGGAEATAYVAERQRAGKANGTINRELAVLTCLLRLAYRRGKLLRLPVVDKLKEADARSGFFEHDHFQAVRAALRPDLRVAVTIAYTYGWRTQSEVLRLERRHVDLDAGTLRLDPGMTKNGEGRGVALTPELRALLAEQLGRIETLQKQTGAITPWLFPYLEGRLRGTRVRDFRKAWVTACKAAGVPMMLRHDLRRTAVRGLERAGVSRSVAMKITGHKTEAVYRRYAIVSEADMRAASEKLAGMFSGMSATAAVNSGGQVVNLKG